MTVECPRRVYSTVYKIESPQRVCSTVYEIESPRRVHSKVHEIESLQIADCVIYGCFSAARDYEISSAGRDL